MFFLRIFLPGVLITLGAYSSGSVTTGQVPMMILGFFLQGVGIVLQSLFFFLIILLLIWFFLTLINPSVNNPIVRTVFFLVDPLITPIQRRLPRQRIDISPLLAAGGFLVINLLILPPFLSFAVNLSYGSGALAPLRGF